jgi:hypothetical protein
MFYNDKHIERFEKEGVNHGEITSPDFMGVIPEETKLDDQVTNSS